jgi:hypothetical protein
MLSESAVRVDNSPASMPQIPCANGDGVIKGSTRHAHISQTTAARPVKDKTIVYGSAIQSMRP